MSTKPNREGRLLQANQDAPPDGKWHLRIQQTVGDRDFQLTDTCAHEHKAGAVEDMHNRLDAKIAMDCE